MLCVDDNELDAEQVRRVARRLDPTLEVSHASDGEDALAHLDAAGDLGPHLVLLDLNMPRLDGHGCLARIRADAARATLPVVVLTTSVRAIDRDAALGAGATDYLVKPLTVRALAALVELARARRARSGPGPTG